MRDQRPTVVPARRPGDVSAVCVETCTAGILRAPSEAVPSQDFVGLFQRLRRGSRSRVRGRGQSELSAHAGLTWSSRTGKRGH